MAALLGERSGGIVVLDQMAGDPDEQASPSAALAIAEAFSDYRRGEGQKAMIALKEPAPWRCWSVRTSSSSVD